MTDLAALFRLEVPPAEIVLRGTVMYWFLFALFRFWLRRGAGNIGIADVLLVVLIADASQNAMAGEYTSIAEGCLLVATLAAWDWATDWASFRSARVRRWLEPPAVLLVRNGQLHRRNLRREMITNDELMASLRAHGLDTLAAVKLACVESDGEISVVPLAVNAAASAGGGQQKMP